MVRVEALERHHAALEALAHDEALGGALLAAGEPTVTILVELLEETLAHLAALTVLATLIGGRGGRQATDEREGEEDDDSLHALPTRRRDER